VGKFIVFEGLDSSGKKTQAELLYRYLRKKKRTKLINFPRYDTKCGKLVASYLKGDFGSKEKLPMEIAAMFFAMDRYQFKQDIESYLKKGNVISDRFTYSNAAFHGAKVKKGRKEAIKWLVDLEKRLPQPDVIIYLDTLPSMSRKLFKNRKNKIKNVKKDIHERDLKYQQDVRKVYLELARRKKWITIKSWKKSKSGLEMKSIKEIHKEIISYLGF
jgi:dTMP kinase